MSERAAQKELELVTIAPPRPELRARRQADFAALGEKKGRYHLPERLASESPVGYRTRVGLAEEETQVALRLLSLERPTAFVEGPAPTERELFEEASLGVLTARQSTNYRGHQQTVLGPEDSAQILPHLRELAGRESEPLEGATHTLLVFSRPYRTPFTFLLTFIGHRAVRSLLTVPLRALRKRFLHEDDIPSIRTLQHIHLGILADAIERAAPIASQGTRHANVWMAPFTGRLRETNRRTIAKLEEMGGLLDRDRRVGWRLALVAQVGTVAEAERIPAPPETWRRIGANLMALRSERILPGINQETRAPAEYQTWQEMRVEDSLTVQCGRAGYNAFAHWTGCCRERAKELLLLERIDVLTEPGQARLAHIQTMLDEVTDRVMRSMPLWADLPLGRALSRNAARGKKAFGLAGQRIYIGGLDRREIEAEGIDWDHACRAFGAAASRGALVAELSGVTALPEDCDLLAGICLMAGPVNQNDIGKSFFEHPDLLAEIFPKQNPTTLLVWTLKAKTVADPIGNEEQLMDARRKGALVDLRAGPRDVCLLRVEGDLVPMRVGGNAERAFADVGNFVRAPDGSPIPGNEGKPLSPSEAEVSPFGPF